MTTDTTYRPHSWPAPPSPKSGIKHDDGKLRWTLLPFGALEQVVAVLEYGARARRGSRRREALEGPMKCVVCAERYPDGVMRGLCFERDKALDCSFADAIVWAVRLARRFERARAEKGEDR